MRHKIQKKGLILTFPPQGAHVPLIKKIMLCIKDLRGNNWIFLD